MDPHSITVDKGVIELTHAPTGCMLIKREVFDKMIKAYPELEIFQPTVINGKEEKKTQHVQFFLTPYMTLNLNVILEKTLVSVRDGQI